MKVQELLTHPFCRITNYGTFVGGNISIFSKSAVTWRENQFSSRLVGVLLICSFFDR